MEKLSDIVQAIAKANPKELATLMEEINQTANQENDCNPIAVRASFADMLGAIFTEWQELKICYDRGQSFFEVHDRGEVYCLDVRQAMANLTLAHEFLKNPPVIQDPKSGGIAVEAIDWSKPVFSSEEVRTMLHVSANTFRKWINGGWIAYTQMEGSDKKLIDKESLMAFLHNPKIFYPSSK